MPKPDIQPPHPLRKPLLISEFTALAVLLASMSWFSGRTAEDGTLAPAWLLIPAIASLVVFLSFIALMYLRWVAAAEGAGRSRQKIVFLLLAITLISVWAYGIANTWLSINAT
ncbi:MAG TPA: hypothetical protein VL091_13480 [Marinobacter sp.]|nr:hypothetical protein [Marinobacter sp.]